MPYIFDEKMGRRKFIKSAGLGVLGANAVVPMAFGATEGTGAHDLARNESMLNQWGREAGEWIPSCCNMCGGQSGILVHVVNGVVDKIEPNHWNPNNYTNISSDFQDGYTEEYGCRDGGSI